MAKKEQRYIINVNREQLKLIADCVDDVSRYAAGDCRMFNTNAAILEAQAKSSAEYIQMRDEAEELLKKTGIVLNPNLEIGANYDYNGNYAPQKQKDLIGNTYQIYREILHFLTEEEGRHNVYSSETLPSGTLGVIKIKKL